MNNIIVEVIGGLGNQLFQYAFGRAVSMQRGTELVLDASRFSSYKLRNFVLDNFGIEAKICFEPPDAILPLYREPHFHYDHSVFSQIGSMRYSGYWQSERYFSQVADKIRSEIQLRCAWPEYYQQLAGCMIQEESVAVHVRRGDYASNASTRAFHGLASVRYFGLAMRLIRSRLARPRFYFFSDDIDWCRENFNGADIEFIDVISKDDDRGLQDCRELLLMSRCRHYILSNSSFSWWSAWLGGDEQTVVVAPDPWFANPELCTRDLLLPGWNMLPIGGD